jgi:tRNA-splicing ligase RtcB
MSWASILEEQTREQAVTTSRMPFLFPHLALMPDAHLGKGATVGSVIPTLGAIIPAAVGVDIGCGMMAVCTGHRAEDLPTDRRPLHEAVSAVIPLSAGKYNTDMYSDGTRSRIAELEALDGIEQAERMTPNWRLQLGSLGSGNHFWELSIDEEDRVWLFLHSGSRGVGNKLAQKHIAVAQKQCEKRWIPLPDKDLAYLVEGEPEFWSYMEALRWAQRFAYLNREEMMHRAIDAFEAWAGPMEKTDEINCHHNYTAREKHFGKDVWLSRKGAIDASEGVRGLIPGSMGAKSYVVTGKGNKLALNSSPHGAGRNHSRAAAKRLFTREDLDARMTGIEWGRSDAFLDEHPDAYKDIDVVMDDAKDLVSIDHVLRQIVNVKGD